MTSISANNSWYSMLVHQGKGSVPLSAGPVADTSGLYHVTSGGMTSWHGFAEKILESFSGRMFHEAPKLVPVLAIDNLSPAKRPQNLSMPCEKLKRTYGLVIPTQD